MSGVTVSLTEQQILNLAYNVLEQDSTNWDPASNEYLTARGFLQIAIGRWETYENTRWLELETLLSLASDGTKTTTAGVFSYACPTNLRFPATYVQTINQGVTTYWQVLRPEEVPRFVNTNAHYCYFLGNPATGYTIYFNPNSTLTTGDKIEYQYYKKALVPTATTDVPEMQNPYFLAYFIASHMSDGGLDPELADIAEELLENMRVINLSQLSLNPSPIQGSLSENAGFGQ